MNHSPFPESKLPRIIPNFPPSSLILIEIPGKVKWGNSVLVCEKYSLPHSKCFSTLGKTWLYFPKWGTALNRYPFIWIGRGMNSSCFWGGGQPPSVITEPDTAGGERHLFTTNDYPRYLVTELLELCSTLQGNCAGQFPAKSVPCKHTQWSPGKPFSASVLIAFETPNGVFDPVLI